MALSYNATTRKKHTKGGRWETVTEVTFDNEYPTGGYELNLAELGLPAGILSFATCRLAKPVAGTTGVVADVTAAGKLQLFEPAKEKEALAELASKTDVHLLTAIVTATGL